MHAVVLVKQVPDLRIAPVGVRADGTIEREAAPATTNPADLHALEAALQLADEVTAVTMGPPNSEEVVRDAIARGADAGVVLCDRALAGSDTWATANALAATIRHLGEADLVVCGMAALDGETGQVGPEIAYNLGVPQATGCEELQLQSERLLARRIVEGGFEWLSLALPAVVTVAETGFMPRYPTMPGRRRAARADLVRLTAADVGLTGDRVGLDASPTKVARMTPAPLADRECRLVAEDFDIDALAAELDALGALGASVARDEVGAVHEDPAPVDPVAASPRVWVACELEDGEHAGVSG